MIQNKNLKRRVIEISYRLKLSHIGSNITAIDIINEIYQKMNTDDKFILSAVHAHLAHLLVKEIEGGIDFVRGQYVETLIEKYGIHCDRKAGCNVSSGSLGHGIGIAVGMALADRTKNVYCLLSDGECAEGSVYEALSIIQDQKINNIRIYINDNGYGAYRKSSLSEIFYDKSFINIVETNMNDYPEYLQGQFAHYKILNPLEYRQVMEILS